MLEDFQNNFDGRSRCHRLSFLEAFDLDGSSRQSGVGSEKSMSLSAESVLMPDSAGQARLMTPVKRLPLRDRQVAK